MQQMWVSVSVCIAAAVIAGTGVHVAAGASNVRAGSDNCVLRNQDGTGCITEMAECKHGSFIFLAHDAYIGTHAHMQTCKPNDMAVLATLAGLTLLGTACRSSA